MGRDGGVLHGLSLALSRIDLATGAVVEMVRNVDSVDYRAATDDIVIGTFDHSVRLFSMATGHDLAEPFELANPNEAPHRTSSAPSESQG
jgi:hypothetical protein